MSRPVILVAGGGTGGHVFAGLAVGRALADLADVEVVFAGSPRGLESKVIPEAGFHLELLDVAPMKGGGLGRALSGGLTALKATAASRALVSRFAPRAVLSVGGYAAGPVSLAAALAGVPLAVLEPNAVLGFANKLLAPFAARAYVAWDEVSASFRKGRSRRLGVPLRPGFEPREYVQHAPKRVLVLGGSQGASALNERLPEALGGVAQRFAGIEVVHQVGRGKADVVSAAYARAGVTGARVLEFVDDVPGALEGADLVIARAGALTVAEIAAVGRAAILVPFPHAADDHQAKNALALEAAGGCVCVRQEAATVVRLEREIGDLLADDARRRAMADAARCAGRPGAARDIAKDLLELARVRATRAGASEGGEGERSGGVPGGMEASCSAAE